MQQTIADGSGGHRVRCERVGDWGLWCRHSWLRDVSTAERAGSWES
jgi:hypothetical protein